MANGGTTHDVHVGPNDQLVYVPPFINNVRPGDVINFIFHPKNHTATQSTFDTPCVRKPGGFDSGFEPVAAGQQNLPTFQITIPDNNPVYVFCRQGDHCSDDGKQPPVFHENAYSSIVSFVQGWYLL
ncbi:hypothetical protein AMATHDRAFT_147705 [Amanita thiersii Skay4041]|uniref:Phytocyanin domain-containing protein n=1 Tax=Amanita thiersii Skay4041 TaxID=703135 RepID=A0A2A9NMF0_9AGAR|nr:hypothetical protein AMATHDRAFT_147705 [Amanita thiersii Skay4041]